jgi:hypothetical protein
VREDKGTDFFGGKRDCKDVECTTAIEILPPVYTGLLEVEERDFTASAFDFWNLAWLRSPGCPSVPCACVRSGMLSVGRGLAREASRFWQEMLVDVPTPQLAACWAAVRYKQGLRPAML